MVIKIYHERLVTLLAATQILHEFDSQCALMIPGLWLVMCNKPQNIPLALSVTSIMIRQKSSSGVLLEMLVRATELHIESVPLDLKG